MANGIGERELASDLLRSNCNTSRKKFYPLSVHEKRHGLFCVRDSGCTLHQNDPGDGYHRLIGDVLPTAGTLHFNNTEDDIVIATDGTIKNGKGGAAYALHTTETPESLLP